MYITYLHQTLNWDHVILCINVLGSITMSILTTVSVYLTHVPVNIFIICEADLASVSIYLHVQDKIILFSFSFIFLKKKTNYLFLFYIAIPVPTPSPPSIALGKVQGPTYYI